MRNRISMRRRGWSGRMPSLPLFWFFIFLFFFWLLSHMHRSHQWTDFNDLYIIRCVSTKNVPIRGCIEIAPHLENQMAKKQILEA